MGTAEDGELAETGNIWMVRTQSIRIGPLLIC